MDSTTLAHIGHTVVVSICTGAGKCRVGCRGAAGGDDRPTVGGDRRTDARLESGGQFFHLYKCIVALSIFQVREAEIRKDVVEEKLQVKKEVKVEKEKEESEGELEDEDLEDFLDWRIKKLS